MTVLSTGDSYEATVVGSDEVTAVGNAGGETGTAAAAGTVTALDQAITATDSSGQNAEELTGLIEVAADVEAGVSGGPLHDAEGEVTGMSTAASSTGGQAHAIPIGTTLSIDHRIVDGVDGETIHQGNPAFLGVSVLATDIGGATVAEVVTGSPAEAAGLSAGDVITAVGGTAIDPADDVFTPLGSYDPADEVTATWTDPAGQSQTAIDTLASGPAD